MQDRGGSFIFLAALLIAFLLFGFRFMDQETEQLNREIEQLEQEIEAQELQLEVTRKLIEEVKQLRTENEELRERMQDWLDEWEVDTWEVTMYAPLDPAAVEGMCYSGDPNITASGAQVEIGETVAAGPSVPFGTRVWIEGHGMRIVQDRGGLIHDGHLDIAVSDKKTATMFGRQKRLVVYQR